MQNILKSSLIFLFVIFISFCVQAQDVDKNFDCAALDLEMSALEQAFKNQDLEQLGLEQDELDRIQATGILPDHLQKKIDRYKQNMQFTIDCGAVFPDFYRRLRDMCYPETFRVGADNFEQDVLPHCEAAVFDYDETYNNEYSYKKLSDLTYRKIAVLEAIVRHYLNARNPHRNFKKALYYIDKYDQQVAGLMGYRQFEGSGGYRRYFIKAEILRRGGYGIEKDEKKAFEMLKRYADQGGSQAECELISYYRNGIGTEINDNEADKLLAQWNDKFPEHKPAKKNYECKSLDYNYIFGED